MSDHRIWKYTLEKTDHQFVHVPKGAELLSVGIQFGSLCLWAKVDADADHEKRQIEIIGTGNPIFQDMGIERRFIGTVLDLDGHLVWHVFERTNG